MVVCSPKQGPDALSVELIAICAVGKALASVEDPEARLRVLRWANERFQPVLDAPPHAQLPAPRPSPPAVPALRLAPEPDLTVDGLDDLFAQPTAPGPAKITEDSGVVLSVAEDLSDLYEPSTGPARPPLLHLVPREELPFDQAMAEFVESFQRLTLECQSA
jgi:hypothetical protein